MSTDMTCDNDGAPSRAVEGRDGRYCSTDCRHAVECAGDGSCCSDGTENLPAVTHGTG